MRLLVALGILGGVTWIAYAFVPAQCAPVTGDTEIFCNRLWTPGLEDESRRAYENLVQEVVPALTS